MTLEMQIRKEQIFLDCQKGLAGGFLPCFLGQKVLILFTKKDRAENQIHVATCEPSSASLDQQSLARQERLPGAVGVVGKVKSKTSQDPGGLSCAV